MHQHDEGDGRHLLFLDSGEGKAGLAAPLFPEAGLLTEEFDVLYEVEIRSELHERCGPAIQLARLAPTRWLTDKSDPLSHQWVNEKAIKVQTVHSAKGLQYKAVLVLWTDMLPVGTDATDEERRLLYVAITRAENDLVLLGSGAGSFDVKFKETCAVRRFPFAPQLHAVA